MNSEPKTAAGAAQIKTSSIAELVPLLREIGNLKRIRTADGENSYAAELFLRAWASVCAGEAVSEIALKITAQAVAAANLGAIDRDVLSETDLDESEITLILERSFDVSAGAISENLREILRGKLAKNFEFDKDLTPDFASRLAKQPRSGATKTGAPKLIFDQPEDHAEHSIAVGIFAVLLAPRFDADIETVFLAALTHHFHNAYLPDSGFAGEEHLGGFLPPIFKSFRRKCLAEVPVNLHAKIWEIFKTIETAGANEAKAFHAADVIDRVLQMRHHAELNEFTLRYAMEEAELVHAGAIQDFHYDVLRASGLIE